VAAKTAAWNPLNLEKNRHRINDMGEGLFALEAIGFCAPAFCDVAL